MLAQRLWVSLFQLLPLSVIFEVAFHKRWFVEIQICNLSSAKALHILASSMAGICHELWFRHSLASNYGDGWHPSFVFLPHCLLVVGKNLPSPAICSLTLHLEAGRCYTVWPILVERLFRSGIHRRDSHRYNLCLSGHRGRRENGNSFDSHTIREMDPSASRRLRTGLYLSAGDSRGFKQAGACILCLGCRWHNWTSSVAIPDCWLVQSSKLLG